MGTWKGGGYSNKAGRVNTEQNTVGKDFAQEVGQGKAEKARPR